MDLSSLRGLRAHPSHPPSALRACNVDDNDNHFGDDDDDDDDNDSDFCSAISVSSWPLTTAYWEGGCARPTR